MSRCLVSLPLVKGIFLQNANHALARTQHFFNTRRISSTIDGEQETVFISGSPILEQATPRRETTGSEEIQNDRSERSETYAARTNGTVVLFPLRRGEPRLSTSNVLDGCAIPGTIGQHNQFILVRRSERRHRHVQTGPIAKIRSSEQSGSARWASIF
ncbi:MAG: hypothetical protein D6690_04385 [Nitrospirae bacterium]|nr:MAG: hypothetical protein D6690_04385 [Nitrospirota bacterium]